MRLSARTIATAACVVFLMTALELCAEESAKTAVDDKKAADSSAVYAEPEAPMPMASMAAAMPVSAGLNTGVPRIELFAGYSYLRAVPTLAAGNRLSWLNGGSTSLAFNLNRYLGLVGDFGVYTNSQVRFTGGYTATVNVDNANVAVLSYLFGPRISFRKHERFTPFVQVLFGGVHANLVTLDDCTANCTLLPAQDSFAMTAGGGLDVKVRRHFAIRIIQAEYLMTNFDDLNTGKRALQNDMRLSAGVVFRFGGNPAPPLPPPAPLSYSCSVTPSSVFIGDTIAASGTAVSLNPTKTAVYTWTVDGGTVTGTSTALSTASIDTRNAAPGSYTLRGHVSEGDKPGENADCTAGYVVRAFDPPTVSCLANPSTVNSGDPSTITAMGTSPQNRPLTYSYSSSLGSMSPSGTTATLTTGGVSSGVITVTCNVADDKGQTATATTPVTVVVLQAPVRVVSLMCPVGFARDARRPARVDNEGKACLDQVALNLQNDSDAKLALVGNAASEEKGGAKLAAQRGVNTKAYLVGEKGIDGARITVYTGSQDEKVVTTTLIPAGATFDSSGDAPVQ